MLLCSSRVRTSSWHSRYPFSTSTSSGAGLGLNHFLQRVVIVFLRKQGSPVANKRQRQTKPARWWPQPHITSDSSQRSNPQDLSPARRITRASQPDLSPWLRHPPSPPQH